MVVEPVSYRATRLKLKIGIYRIKVALSKLLVRPGGQQTCSTCDLICNTDRVNTRYRSVNARVAEYTEALDRLLAAGEGREVLLIMSSH